MVEKGMSYAILILASFLAAFASGAAGFGGALLLLPVVTTSLGAEVAVPVLTIAQLIGNLSRMLFGIKQIDWKPVGLFSVTALPLAALGAFGFSTLPKDLVTRCIGGALIGLVLFKTMTHARVQKEPKSHALGRRGHRPSPRPCRKWRTHWSGRILNPWASASRLHRK